MTQVAFYDTKPYDRTAMLAAAGADAVQWTFHDFRLSAETASTAQGADAVCIFVNDRVDRACLEKLAAQNIKLITLRCAGFNQVDLVAARELGIAVTRVPAYSPYAVAEHTVALLMTLNRNIHRAYNRVREHNFSLAGLLGFDLYGKTVGLIGTGKIGRCTAQIFRGFGCRVIAYDPYPATEWALTNRVEYTGLDEVIQQSDVVSLHLPLTPDSHHLLNKERLAQMKKGAYLLNTSRGKLVDTCALIESLKAEHLGGVALDVYEEEEGIFFEDYSGQVLHDDTLALLLSLPNVLITSHQAFLTREALGEIARVTVANLAAVKSSQYLPETVL